VQSEVANAARTAAKRKSAKRVPADDPRWKQVQAELLEHQKQLEATRQGVAKFRQSELAVSAAGETAGPQSSASSTAATVWNLQ
jgi:hypothetical protein